ncbi:hypothetical protein MPLDJ20_220009 [Mesorhizobium plurifarium]|uniref:Uncharacterized protein n=1 Tax=Mesorhizobium plurifarium TaxID=69974 RepID=A0A090F8Z2_MESPL|nr:hypothetical protein MPLDJ20_220009 [Mesorhizobium plurifarium]
MIHNNGGLLKESMYIPIQLDGVRRANPFHAVKQPNDHDLARQEFASGKYASPPFGPGITDRYVSGVQSPCAANVIC